jgi:hypothetical protein
MGKQYGKISPVRIANPVISFPTVARNTASLRPMFSKKRLWSIFRYFTASSFGFSTGEINKHFYYVLQPAGRLVLLDDYTDSGQVNTRVGYCRRQRVLKPSSRCTTAKSGSRARSPRSAGVVVWYGLFRVRCCMNKCTAV